MAMTPDEFAARLDGISFDLPSTMRRMVLILERQAKREAPVDTGTLRRSITSDVQDGGHRGVVGTNVAYALAVHQGSRPHVIVPRRAVVLAFPGSGGRTVFARRVNHPGTRANPFMKRAMEKAAPEIQEAGWEVLVRVAEGLSG